MAELEGALALVTGGASGIGAAVTARLRRSGARVAVADLAAPAPGACELALHADVAAPETWTTLADSVVAGLGGLDVVHLNAGASSGVADLAALDDAAYARVMGVNVDHVVFGLRAVVPRLGERGSGRVVVTASLAGLTPMAADPIYTASKHAVVGLVRAYAPTAARRGVTLTAVCPGIVDTPLLGAARAAVVASGFPLLSAEDVAAAVEAALRRGAPGECWFVQPGREPAPYRFGGVPGPRGAGTEGMRPPF